MFVRVVTLDCKAGMEELSAYFLEPSIENDNPSFGVVSIWPDKETLDTMKKSERYRTLIQNMSPLIETLTDRLYLTV